MLQEVVFEMVGSIFYLANLPMTSDSYWIQFKASLKIQEGMGNNIEGVDVGGINTKYDRKSLYIFGKINTNVQVWNVNC